MSTSPSLQFLLERRSISALTGPAPSRETIALMLRAAATVPDHGELRPYRFVVVDTEEGRTRFGDALAAVVAEARPAAPATLLEKAKKKAFAAPACVVLIASPVEGRAIPVWEQVTTASCCGYAIVLAAHALGFGAIWKTSGVLEGSALRSALALTEGERVLGWINVGTPAKEASPRPALDLALKASVLDGGGLVPLKV